MARGVCRMCGAGLEHTFVDLGLSPLCEGFVPASDLDAMEPYFPLHAMVCGQCFLVQLNEHVSPARVSPWRAGFSSWSDTRVASARAYCAAITRRMPLGRKTLVVELASNDGYLLQHFVTLGIPVLGIEPAAKAAKAAIKKGIHTRIDVFGRRLAAELVASGLKADLIIGNNVLAQVPDLNDLVAGLACLIKPEGLITLEFPPLERLIADSQFDTIRHERFSYLSLIAVERLAARHGLKLVDVEELPAHGGSLRVYLARAGSARPVTLSITDLLAREGRLKLESLTTYASFEERVRCIKRQLLSFLLTAKTRGKRICGYGAPGRGSTLLNYCGIGPDLLDFTVDRNPGKQGLFTPGMHIPIHAVEAIYEARPDYILILPWKHTAEIVAQMGDVAAWGAKFVVPIPDVAVIDPGDARRQPKETEELLP